MTMYQRKKIQEIAEKVDARADSWLEKAKKSKLTLFIILAAVVVVAIIF